MQCIKCKSSDTAVINTRECGDTHRRRYQCRECGERFSTLESYEDTAFFNDGKWVNQYHLDIVARQLEEGAAELAALAKLIAKRRPGT